MRTPVGPLVRHAVAVIVGYVIFASLAAAFFALSHRDPHTPQDWFFTGFSIAYGILAATLAGYAAAALGRERPLSHARTLALAIATVAIVSFLARPGEGAVWSQVASVFLFAPCALLGGWLRSLKG